MKQSGFSMMELMVVIGIMAILVALAIPSYSQYTQRAHYTEITQAALPYKLAVTLCYQTTHDLNQCVANQHGIPADVTRSDKNLVASISVSQGGRITLTPQSRYGFTDQDQYILTPQVHHDTLSWTASGPAVEQGYAK